MNSRFLIYSAIFHIAAFAFIEIQLDSKGESDLHVDVSRVSQLRAAAAINRLTQTKSAMLGESKKLDELEVQYEDLNGITSMDAMMDRAAVLEMEVDEIYYSKLREILGNETANATVRWSRREKPTQKRASHGSRDLPKRIENISLWAERRLEDLMRLETGYSASVEDGDEPASSLESSGGHPSLIDTISHENSAPSRFIENGAVTGLWSHIDEWYTFGPFDEKEDPRFAKELPNGFRIDHDYRASCLDGRLSGWDYQKTKGPLLSIGERAPQGIHYAYSEIYSDAARTIFVSAQCSEMADIWVNGEPLIDRGAESGDDRFRRLFQLVRLDKGYNNLLARVDRTGTNAYLWVGHSWILADGVEIGESSFDSLPIGVSE